MSKPPKLLEDRLLNRINEYPSPNSEFSDCWYWNINDIGKTDYRDIWVGLKDVDRRRIGVHRVSAHVWLDLDLYSDLNVCHKCDNPPCFNPNHLFIGTQFENVKDMNNKDRHSKGENNGIPKLTKEQVLEIRKMFDLGIDRKSIAKKFGVSYTTIWQIIKRIKWKHI